MRLIPVLMLTALPVALSAQARPAVPASDDAKSVREVVNTYLHGLKFNDVESFKKAFWPQAKLLFVGKDGGVGQLTQEDWYKGFAGSAGKEEPGELRIAAVEVTHDAASVKVVEDYPYNPPTRYTDYISLLKIGGRWWIVNKIYTVERFKR